MNQPDTSEIRTRVITVRIPEDLHQAVKVAAAEAGQSMNLYVADLLRDATEVHRARISIDEFNKRMRARFEAWKRGNLEADEKGKTVNLSNLEGAEELGIVYDEEGRPV